MSLSVVFSMDGALAPVFTPIDDRGHINVSVIPAYMRYLNENGVNGILVGGTTGEAASLSLSERKEVLDAWLKAAKPLGVKVMAQVGGVPLPDVIEMAKYAEAANTDAILTLPELYYKPRTAEQLVSYLEIISNAAPSLPLLYYHFPMMSGVDGNMIRDFRLKYQHINMPQFFTLASSKIPNFKGMKADLGVAEQVTELLAEDQKIFIANHHLAPAALMGHDSSIATVTNMFPNLVQKIVQSVKVGDVVNARALQQRLNKLVNSIVSHGDYLPSMKVAMELVTGITVGPPRQPLTPLEKQQRERMEETLRTLHINMQV